MRSEYIGVVFYLGIKFPLKNSKTVFFLRKDLTGYQYSETITNLKFYVTIYQHATPLLCGPF